MKHLPRAMLRERLVVRGMVRYDDPLRALQCVPHHTRSLWVTAFQSYVWNFMATQRIERHGLEPVPGDLITWAEVKVETTDQGAAEEEPTEGAVEGAASCVTTSPPPARQSAPRVEVVAWDGVAVHPVLDRAPTMQEVVLPLPGSDSVS